MTSQQSSLSIGKNKDYFSDLKIRNKNLHALYVFFGKGDLANGYNSFQDYCVFLKSRIIDYIDDSNEYDFSVWLYKHKIYSSRVGAYNFASDYVYRSGFVSYPFYKKLRKIVRLYKKEKR